MSYFENIKKIFDKQRKKGLKQYGQTLEDNNTLKDPYQIIEEAQEELVDALMYLEHAKRNIKR